MKAIPSKKELIDYDSKIYKAFPSKRLTIRLDHRKLVMSTGCANGMMSSIVSSTL